MGYLRLLAGYFHVWKPAAVRVCTDHGFDFPKRTKSSGSQNCFLTPEDAARSLGFLVLACVSYAETVRTFSATHSVRTESIAGFRFSGAESMEMEDWYAEFVVAGTGSSSLTT